MIEQVIVMTAIIGIVLMGAIIAVVCAMLVKHERMAALEREKFKENELEMYRKYIKEIVIDPSYQVNKSLSRDDEELEKLERTREIREELERDTISTLTPTKPFGEDDDKELVWNG